MTIGIIYGSIRDGRSGQAVGDWVTASARGRDTVYEVIDLKAMDVPLLTSATVPGSARKRYDDPRTQAWSDAVDACDGFLFVTPEYNHGVPGAFKNAFDSLGDEWVGKSVAFVSYGFDGGVRAVEQWRQVVVNFQMVDVRSTVSLSLVHDWTEGDFAPTDRRAGELARVFDALEAMTARLR